MTSGTVDYRAVDRSDVQLTGDLVLDEAVMRESARVGRDAGSEPSRSAAQESGTWQESLRRT